MNRRMMRINDEIFRELSDVFLTQMRDPRINSLVSITKVDTSPDLSYCNVHLTILDENKHEILKIINGARKFIRKQIAERINLRLTPEFKFIIDDSLEYSAKISDIISEITNKKP